MPNDFLSDHFGPLDIQQVRPLSKHVVPQAINGARLRYKRGSVELIGFFSLDDVRLMSIRSSDRIHWMAFSGLAMSVRINLGIWEQGKNHDGPVVDADLFMSNADILNVDRIEALTNASSGVIVIDSLNVSTNQITTPDGATFINGDRVRFGATGAGVIPIPLVAGTDYYVRKISASVFTVHLTQPDALANANVIDLVGSTSAMHATAATAIDEDTEIIGTAANHAFSDGDLVRFVLGDGGVLTGTGIEVATDYFVNVVDPNELTIHATLADGLSGDDPIDISDGSYSGTVNIVHGFAAPVSVLNQAAVTDEQRGLTVWEMLGLSSDPQISYDIVADESFSTGVGNMMLELMFTREGS